MFFSRNHLLYLGFIILFTLLMYFNLLRFYIPITQEIIPWGDPFTYEMSYYELLNRIRYGSFLSAIEYIFISNWYWLQKILVFIFSPILISEPYSLCIINFFLYGFASYLIFIYFEQNGYNISISVFCSLLIWLYPINYNFIEYSALPIMGLDSTFLGALYCLIFSYLIFLNGTKKIINQLLFAICLCAALIGRGNSITVLGMLLLYPTINYILNLIKNKNFSDLKNFIIPSVLFVFTILIFYGIQLKQILNYYSVFKGFFTNSLGLTFPYIKHVPGIFFYYPDMNKINLMVETDYRLVGLSLLSHLIIIYAIYNSKNITNRSLRLGLNTGIFIFYATFFLNLMLWMNPHINIYNAQLIWAPMRVGFLLIISITLTSKFEKYSKSVFNFLSFIIIGSIFLISTNLYSTHKAELYKNKVNSNPENIKKIQAFIKENSEDKKAIILWYGPYLNPRIVNYYSLKKGEKPINFYRDKYADDIWNQSFNDPKFIEKVKIGIENIFNEANLIILQEKSINYSVPYAFGRYSNFISDQISNGKLDEFYLIGSVKSSRDNLLIFKRSNKSKNFKYIIENNHYTFIYDTPENIF